jgi:methyl-accepting chemotaxis protein
MSAHLSTSQASRRRNWPDLDLRSKLFAAIGVLALAALLVGGIALWGIARIGDQLHEATAVRLPSTGHLGALADLTASYRIGQFQFTLAPETDRPAVERSLANTATAISARNQSYRKLLAERQDIAEHESFTKLWQTYLATQPEVRKMMADGLPLQATDLLNGDAKGAFNAMRAVIERMGEKSARRANELQERSEAQQRLVVWVIGGTLVITSALGIVVGGSIARRIATSVRTAQHAASEIAEGRLDGVIVAHGNDEIGRLLRSLDQMRQGLAGIVGDARRTAESVTTAMREIAAGNHDLSARTEAEASLLQGLAASLSQLKETAAGNARDAGEAATLCQRSREAVDATTESSRALCERMDQARANARQIAEILGMIDSVAHQTNLLALNAAVEAARAGEHGRGFAVVAAEVRTLAQRSGEAARQIRTLVETSEQSVQGSAELARATGAAMDNLKATIAATVDTVTQIARGSTDQSNEVARMADSIQTLEHGTQRNAALVEQMAASSTLVHQHAQQLTETMQAFRIIGTHELAPGELATS